ncbi:unnamed protein product [Effrenium voratum]|uniref:Protein kinase domain-containing protein n=1 Tax=Effrenium voratum TaxID=2562239 RepID=A0AA36MYV2_9DINO|nr:unnamed protein product [Effrenium voratum]
MADGRFDDLLLSMARQHSNVEELTWNLFSFFERRTDLFHVMERSNDRMGFGPGMAEKMLMKHFRFCHLPSPANEDANLLQSLPALQLHRVHMCRSTIQPISVMWRHSTPSRHYKRISECVAAAEHSVTEARMSASAVPCARVPLPTISIEPPKLLVTVSDPDSGRRVSHKISLAFCDAIPCLLTGTNIVALDPDCKPVTFLEGKLGILLAKAPTKSKDLRATMTCGNTGEEKYAVASQLWLVYADDCSPLQLQQILLVMSLQGAILHNITPRWQIEPSPLRQGFYGLLVSGKAVLPVEQEPAQNITMKVPGKVRVVDLYNEVKLSVMVKGHENVVDFRGIFYMDAMECKQVSDILSPAVACNIATYHSEIALVFNSIEGLSLHTWVRSERGLSEACALHALKGIGEALRYIHSLKIVHSNVNPESIFIKRDGDSVLADFGFAVQMADELQIASGPVNARSLAPPTFSAPEQVGDHCTYGNWAAVSADGT